ncbi:MAG TPA: hypothetical protein VKU87_08500, partial [Thermomicrobiaceae bacterium]|nr:hypothetical protein [Thermomicrobiaceae bacterium]
MLHERSTSAQVERYAQRIDSSRHRINSAVERMSQFGADRLGHRIVIDPGELSTLKQAIRSNDPPIVITLQLGAWRLLSRLLSQAAGEESDAFANVFPFDRAAPRTEDSASTTWFRARSLIAPPPAEIGTRRWVFAVAPLRPDPDSILVHIREIGSTLDRSIESESSTGVWPAEVIEYTQAAVREYIDQWCVRERLWSHPAEAA